MTENKTYQLLKNLPNIGAGKFVVFVPGCRVYEGKDDYGENFTLRQKDVENNSAWFRLIPEPVEWEIVSFVSKRNPTVKWSLQDNGRYKNNWGSDWTKEAMLYDEPPASSVKSGTLEIHSVLRKSDNTLFTVGDLTNCDNETIKGFLVGGRGERYGHTENDLWVVVNRQTNTGGLIGSIEKLPPASSNIEQEMKYIPITKITDQDNIQYCIVQKDAMQMHEAQNYFDGRFGYIENDNFFPSKKRKNNNFRIIHGINSPKLYTYQELLSAEQKAFEAGRIAVADGYSFYHRYKTFSDFKNSNQ
jgi:hypothetical protein